MLDSKVPEPTAAQSISTYRENADGMKDQQPTLLERDHHREWAYKFIDKRRAEQNECYPIDDGGFNEGIRLAVLTEEVGEVARVLCGIEQGAIGGEHALRRLCDELTDVAAVAVRWLEAL